MANILKFSEFEPTKINFAESKQNKAGGKIVYLSYGANKDRIYLQTPVVPLPFGVSPYTDKVSGSIQSYSVDIAFRDLDSNPDLQKFYNVIQSLDNHLIATGVSKTVEWFGKAKSKDVIADNYRTLIKKPADIKYSDTFKVKIQWNRDSNTFESQFFKENREETDYEYVIKNSTAKMLLELRSVWFVGQQFGVTFSLVQLGVVSRPQKFVGFALLDEVEEEDYSKQSLAKALDDF
jgi:Family of unknown function (DUF5871)